jgi:peptidoglycan/LPS O-acetylase OafA/YrhL
MHPAEARSNNFNLVRLTAAMAVIASHSFPLSGNPVEPLSNYAGITLGTLAVDCFFIVSGFLVTGSALNGSSPARFFAARALRIYPALVVAVLLITFGLGAVFTTLPLSTYYRDPGLGAYVWNALGMPLRFNHDALPGVFTSVPFRGAIAGSLWTLAYEVRMYMVLGLVWLALSLDPARRVERLKWFVLIIAGVTLTWEFVRHFLSFMPDYLGHFATMFFLGAFFNFWRAEVWQAAFWPALALTAMALTGILGPDTTFVAYTLSLPLTLLCLAIVPAGPVRQFNRLGDYSYGVYIYGFPVQQAVAAMIPGVGPLRMFALAAPIALGVAVVSWHLIERPALSLKRAIA